MTRLNHKNIHDALTPDSHLLLAAQRPWYVRLWRWLRPAALSVPVAADVRISPASAFWLQNPHLAPLKPGHGVFDGQTIGTISAVHWSEAGQPGFTIDWGSSQQTVDAVTANELHFAYLDLIGWGV